MKLLLTSDGITNESIATALADLVAKPLSQTKAAFIITAQNNQDLPLAETKGSQFKQLAVRGIEYFIVDPANETHWREKLEDAEVIIIGGGNTFHLLNESRKSGFDMWLLENANSKVYVGTSAGSIIMTPNIGIAPIDDGDVNTSGITDLSGLGLIDFELSPHTPENVSIMANLEYSKTTSNKLLMMDNQTALKISGNKVEVVSEGHWQWCQNGNLTR
jgi:dipeptidase E